MANNKGSGILFFDRQKQSILVFLRDNKPHIPYPNCIDILGGHGEPEEEPSETVVREMAEELFDLRNNQPYQLKDFTLFTVDHTCGVDQYIYCKEIDFAITDIKLLEGQKLLWITEDQLDSLEIAYDFKDIIARFFRSDFIKNYSENC